MSAACATRTSHVPATVYPPSPVQTGPDRVWVAATSLASAGVTCGACDRDTWDVRWDWRGEGGLEARARATWWGHGMQRAKVKTKRERMKSWVPNRMRLTGRVFVRGYYYCICNCSLIRRQCDRQLRRRLSCQASRGNFDNKGGIILCLPHQFWLPTYQGHGILLIGLHIPQILHAYLHVGT